MVRIPLLSRLIDSSAARTEPSPHAGQALTLVSRGILIGLIFLLPLFFVPSALVTFPFSKILLGEVFVILAFILYLITVLRRGEFSYPRHIALLAIPTVVVAYLLASLFSSTPAHSLFGYGFEPTAFSFILVLFLLLFLVVQLFQTKEHIFYAYLAFFGAFILLGVFHLLRFIGGPDLLSFGIFPSMASNTIGSWNDLTAFFAVGTLLSLVTLEELRLRTAFRSVIYVVFGVSLVFLIIGNSAVVWYVLGSISLLYLIYAFLMRDSSVESETDSTGPRVSVNALIVLIISVLFVLVGGSIGDSVSQYLGISTFDVRPSWTATFNVARSTLSDSPIVGAGPNHFSYEWNNFKPDGVNETQYWNTEFNYGVGLVPTFLVTTGLLGALAWIFFLGTIGYLTIRTLFRVNLAPLNRYLTLSSGAVTIFLWSMAIVSVPGTVMIAITFVFTGLFLGSVVGNGVVDKHLLKFSAYPRAGFVAVLVLVLLLLSSVVFGYVLGQKTVASVFFQRSSLAAGEGELENSDQLMRQAIQLDENDIYYRSLSRINIAQANTLVAEAGNDGFSNQQEAEFTQNFQDAIVAGEIATQVKPIDAQNWSALSGIFHQAVQYGIDGAYDRADQALAEAIERNPKSPALRLQRARLEIANEDLQAARTYIAEARELKSNYTEAIFLLAQIEASEGNIAEAIAQTEQVANLAPRDAGLLFQLGLLYYQDENYSGAVQALERATELVEGYANAQYFLGLSQYRLGDTEEAIALFEELIETNPDNSDLQQILTNMRNNFPLFEGVSDPISDQVDSDAELPVEETSPEEGTSEANISEDEVVEGADAEGGTDEE